MYLNLRQVMEKGKPGAVLRNKNWLGYVTVTIKEIKDDGVVVEGAHLVESPHTYELENHPEHWLVWILEVGGEK